MIRRAIGLLLILRALSPFIWLLAAYLFVSAIIDRFDQVSLRYSAELNVQLEVYDELANRIGEQIEAIRPTVEAVTQEAVREFVVLVAYIEGTIAQLKALPPIDLSKIMPDLHFPKIQLPKITLDWKVPNVPIVREVINAIRSAILGVANSVNSVFETLSRKIGEAFEKAVEPLQRKLVENVMNQLRPYINAYARLSSSFALLGTLYASLETKIAVIQSQLAGAAEIWQRIGDDLSDQLGLSVSLVETVPENLGKAIGESATLLVAFGIFTLALFMVFYWAGMMRDLRIGWMFLTGRHEEGKRLLAEPKQPPLERWLEKLKQPQSSGSAS